MHTPSTRILSALAYDRGRSTTRLTRSGRTLIETLALVEHAARGRSAMTARTSGRASAGASATASGRRSRTGSRPRT